MPSILDFHSQKEKENVDLFGSTTNLRVQMQALQRRNAELEAELSGLQSRLMTF